MCRMTVLNEFEQLLRKYGYTVRIERENKLTAYKENGTGFVIEIKDKEVRIYPNKEHEEAYKDEALEDIRSIEEELSEVSSLIADLKVITIRSSLKVTDHLRPYLEELVEEFRE